MNEPRDVVHGDDNRQDTPDAPAADGTRQQDAGVNGDAASAAQSPQRDHAPQAPPSQPVPDPSAAQTAPNPPAPQAGHGGWAPGMQPGSADGTHAGHGGAPQQPGYAAAPVHPRTPSPLAAKEPWIAALAHAGLAMAGAVAASIVVVVLGIVGVQFTGDEDIASTVASQWFPMIIQFLGAGFLGSFGTTVSAMGFTVSASLFFVPLVVPVCAVLAVLLFGRRATPPLAVTPLWRAAAAGIAGAGFAIVVLVLQLAAPISVVVPNAPGASVRAISVWSIILGIVIVAAATFTALSPRGGTRSRWRSGALQAVEHLGGFGAVLAIALLVVVMIDSGGYAGAMLLLAPAILPLARGRRECARRLLLSVCHGAGRHGLLPAVRSAVGEHDGVLRRAPALAPHRRSPPRPRRARRRERAVARPPRRGDGSGRLVRAAGRLCRIRHRRDDRRADLRKRQRRK